MMNKITHDRPMFDLGIKEIPVRVSSSGEQYGGSFYVSMKCGCDGETLYWITKNSDSSWRWNGTDFWAMGWSGCNIHLYDDNGEIIDEAELLCADVETIAEIVQRRKERDMH